MRYRSRLRQAYGVLLEAGNERSVLLVGNDEIEELAGRRARQQPIEEKGDGCQAASYRIWRAFADKAHPVLGARLQELLDSSGERRAFARAALQCADDVAIRRAGLSTDETNWLLMWSRHNAGDKPGALAHLCLLPEDGYPDKLAVLAAAWSDVSENPELVGVARSHLASFGDELADLLRIGLGEHVDSKPTVVPAQRGVSFDRGAAVALRAVGDLSSHAGDSALGGEARDLWAVVQALADWKWPDGNAPRASLMVTLPDVVLDELIDAGLAYPSLLDAMEDDGDQRQRYFRGRLVPELLSEAELRELPYPSEQARRQFLAGESTERVGDEAARRLVLLDRLRGGDPKVLSELVPLLPAQQQSIALAVGSSLRDDAVHPDALSDLSTWPVLAPLLVAGTADQRQKPEVQRLGEWWNLERARASLYEWNWDGAVESARSCLKTSNDEGLRDEALNLLACALLQQGNAEAAALALKDALAGADSPELIINFGIAAADHDRMGAAEELARLASDAPTLELRVTAAERAVLLWRTRVVGLSQDEDEPPDSLVKAIRGLSVEPTTLDEHVDVMRFLSWADEDWTADPRHTAASPHAGEAAHQYFVARAKGPTEGVHTLAQLLHANPGDQWLTKEQEELVEGVISFLLDHEQNAVGVAMWALEATDAGLELDSRQRILLPTLGVRELAIYMMGDDAGEGVPKRELFEKLKGARAVLRGAPDLDAALYGDLIDAAAHAFAAACWQGWTAEFDAIVDGHNSILSQLAGMSRRQVSRPAVRQAVAPMVNALDEMARYVDDVCSELKNEELQEAINELRHRIPELRASLVSLAG